MAKPKTVVGVLLWIYAGARTIMDVLGGIDFVVTKSEDPGWLVLISNFVVNPPSWFLLCAIAIGFALVFWPSTQSSTRRSRMSIPVVGMILFGIAFTACFLWWLGTRVSGTDASAEQPATIAREPIDEVADKPNDGASLSIAEKKAAQRSTYLKTRQGLEAEVFDADGELVAASLEPNPTAAERSSHRHAGRLSGSG